jgi:hypothetical protein
MIYNTTCFAFAEITEPLQRNISANRTLAHRNVSQLRSSGNAVRLWVPSGASRGREIRQVCQCSRPKPALSAPPTPWPRSARPRAAVIRRRAMLSGTACPLTKQHCAIAEVRAQNAQKLRRAAPLFYWLRRGLRLKDGPESARATAVSVGLRWSTRSRQCGDDKHRGPARPARPSCRDAAPRDLAAGRDDAGQLGAQLPRAPPVPSARPRAEAVEQLAEHLPLAGGGDAAGVEHSLGAEPVDKYEQLVRRQVDVHTVAKFA